MFKQALILILMMNLATMTAQSIIALPYDNPIDFEWEGVEQDYHSEIWDTRVITNVSRPTLEIFPAPEGKNTGIAMIIAPGGGLYAHSIQSEGYGVAKYLNEIGITALVLKYRTVPYQGDAIRAFSDPNENAPKKAAQLLPYAVADGLAALDYVRSNATQLKIDPDRVGFMGFSAGGAVTMGVTYAATHAQMPDFIVPVYPWMIIVDKPVKVPHSAGPMLAICSSDDPLDLAPMSIDLYQDWTKAGKSASLMMYSKGGHGFGTRSLGTASDHWLDRCHEWLLDEGILPID